MDVPLIIAILYTVFKMICHVDSSVLCPANITNGLIENSCRREEGDLCTYNCADNCYKRLRGLYLSCINGTYNTTTENLCRCKASAPKSKSEIKSASAIFIGIMGTTPLLMCLFAIILKYSIRRQRAQRQCSQRPITYGEWLTSQPVPVQRAETGVQSRIHMLCNTVADQYSNHCSREQEATSSNGSAYPDVPPPLNRPQLQEATSSNGSACPNVPPPYNCPQVQEATSSNGSAYPVVPPSYSSIAVGAPEVSPPPPSYEEAVSRPAIPNTRHGNNL